MCVVVELLHICDHMMEEEREGRERREGEGKKGPKKRGCSHRNCSVFCFL